MKRRNRKVVPRSSLRERLSGLMQKEGEDPWAVETVPDKRKPLLEGYPFTVFKEMHQQLFPKVLACLTVIVIVLLVNIINLPAINSVGDGLYGVVTWNMDVASYPGRALEVINSWRGETPTRDEGLPVDTWEGFALPVTTISVLSGYGMREHPVRGTEMHYGIDFLAPAGSPVFAALEGTVLQAGADPHYGNSVILEHDNGLKTFYGGLTDLKVTAGDRVDTGQELALVAQAEGEEPYLHFEVWVDDRPVNPGSMLPLN